MFSFLISSALLIRSFDRHGALCSCRWCWGSWGVAEWTECSLTEHMVLPSHPTEKERWLAGESDAAAIGATSTALNTLNIHTHTPLSYSHPVINSLIHAHHNFSSVYTALPHHTLFHVILDSSTSSTAPLSHHSALPPARTPLPDYILIYLTTHPSPPSHSPISHHAILYLILFSFTLSWNHLPHDENLKINVYFYLIIHTASVYAVHVLC